MSEQWQAYVESVLDAHSATRWVLKPKAQKYERVNGERILTRVEEVDADWAYRKAVRDAVNVEAALARISRDHRTVIELGFLATRRLADEVDAKYGAGAWSGKAPHAGASAVLGKRVLVCALTASAKDCAARDRADALGVVIAAAVPPVEGTAKLILKARASLLARVLPERDALVREACAAVGPLLPGWTWGEAAPAPQKAEEEPKEPKTHSARPAALRRIRKAGTHWKQEAAVPS